MSETESKPKAIRPNSRKGHSQHDAAGKTKVIHCSHEQVFKSLEGHCVARIRESLKDVFNIAADATARVNGVCVGPDYRLNANETLEFVRSTGKKGGDLLTDEEVMKMWRISRSQYEKWLEKEAMPKTVMEDGSTRHFKLALEEWERGRIHQSQSIVGQEPTSSVSTSSEIKPEWDQDRRTLSVGGILIKKFRNRGTNQVLILQAFAEEGWPGRIDDPLPSRAGKVSAKRLGDTTSAMNESHRIEGLIRFEGDGTGEGVRWEIDLEKVRKCLARPRTTSVALRGKRSKAKRIGDSRSVAGVVGEA